MNDPSIARSFYNTDVATEHYLGIRWPVAIWQSVLVQAIEDILYGPSLHETRGMTLNEMKQFGLSLRAAAEHWVEDEVNEPRRFVWVCEQLGLEPSAVRRSIEDRRSAL